MSIKQELQDAAVGVAEARRKLVEAEARYDALFQKVMQGVSGENHASTAQAQTLPVPKNVVGKPQNYTERVLALVRTKPNKIWSNSEIIKELSDIPTTTVPAILSRLCNQLEKIEKIGHGKWKSK